MWRRLSWRKVLLTACFVVCLCACSISASAALTAEEAEIYRSILWAQEQEYTPVFAKLVDFDNNGKEELFSIVGLSSQSYEQMDYQCLVWGVRNGKIEQLGDYGLDLRTSLIVCYFKQVNGKNYFISDEGHSDMGKFRILFGIQTNGSWGLLEACSETLHRDDNDRTIYSYYLTPGNKSTTEKEYNRLRNQYLNGATKIVTFSMEDTWRGINGTLAPGYENAWEETMNYLWEIVRQTPAQRTIMTAQVNGTAKQFESYLVNGNNYLKLRDLAYVLNGTEKQFSVHWDQSNQRIDLKSKTPYQVVGGELTLPMQTEVTTVIQTVADIWLDGESIGGISAYNAKGNNYFKVRGLASVLNFKVTWNENKQLVELATKEAFEENKFLRMDKAETAERAAKVAEEKHLATWKTRHPNIAINFVVTADFDEDGTYETFLMSESFDKNLWFVRDNEISAIGQVIRGFGFVLLKSEAYHFTQLLVRTNEGNATATEEIISLRNGEPYWVTMEKEDLPYKIYNLQDGTLVESRKETTHQYGLPTEKRWDVYYRWDPTQQKYVEIK